MHHLDFEKVIDKLGSKYEAVIRMSAKAKKFAEGEMPEGHDAKAKITSMALHAYLGEQTTATAGSDDNRK